MRRLHLSMMFISANEGNAYENMPLNPRNVSMADLSGPYGKFSETSCIVSVLKVKTARVPKAILKTIAIA